MILFILAHYVWSRPSGRGLSPPQITPCNYGRAAESFWESASVLHTSLCDSNYMTEKTERPWSSVEEKMEERMEQRRQFLKEKKEREWVYV